MGAATAAVAAEENNSNNNNDENGNGTVEGRGKIDRCLPAIHRKKIQESN